MTDVLLEVEDLTVDFPTDDGVVTAVRGVSYTLRRGESLGIVGALILLADELGDPKPLQS